MADGAELGHPAAESAVDAETTGVGDNVPKNDPPPAGVEQGDREERQCNAPSTDAVTLETSVADAAHPATATEGKSDDFGPFKEDDVMVKYWAQRYKLFSKFDDGKSLLAALVLLRQNTGKQRLIEGAAEEFSLLHGCVAAPPSHIPCIYTVSKSYPMYPYRHPAR